MIRTKKFENLPQITTISPSGKIVITENGVDKVISFEDFSNLPPSPEVWNNPSTTFTASEINVTDIQSAADSKLLDLKINTVSKFVVRKDGNLGIGVANAAARLDISDIVLAGSGSLAGSILNLAQTWNTTGNPTAIKLNVTNTGSGATSNLLDLQVGGDSKLRVDKTGRIYFPAQFSPNKPYIGPNSSYGLILFGEDVDIYASYSFRLNGSPQISGYLQFGLNTNALHPILYRDADSIIGQRNGISPQSFRIYNTYTSSTNFERLNLRWDTNVLKIGTEKGTGGGTARAMEFQTDGTSRWSIDTSGRLISQGQYGVFSMWQGGFHITSGGTGTIARFYGDNGHTRISSSETSLCLEIPRLTFNGTTSSFPAIKRNGAGIQIRLADDSANTTLEAGNIYATGNLGIGTTAPAAKLHIVGPNYLTSIIDAPLFPALHLYSNGVSIGYIGSGNISGAAATDLGIQAPSGSKLFLAAGNTAPALTVNAGLVGIGTTNPSSALHVSSGNTAVARFSGPTSPIAAFSINDNFFGTFGSAGGTLTGGTVTDLAFQTSNNLVFATGGTALSNIRMFVASAGNVGIGTTSPNVSLETVGTIRSSLSGFSSYYTEIRADVSLGNILRTSGNPTFTIQPNGTTVLTLTAGATANNYLSGNLQVGNSKINGVADIAYIDLYNPTTGNIHIANTSTNLVTGNILFETGSSATERMRISSAGNLGLGTSAPLAKLDIAETWNSNISVTGASGTGSVATITFATQAAAIPVGATVVVSSVNPSGYNGTFVVTASTVTSISYTNSTSTTYVSSGTVQQLFTAVKVNVTDTASNANSLLMDLQVGGASKFKVDKTGIITNPYGYIGQLSSDLLIHGGSNNTYFTVSNGGGIVRAAVVGGYIGGGGFAITNNGSLMFSSISSPNWSDTFLLREAANTLVMRNGVNPQAFRLYGTYTDASNYARLAISCDTSGNAILATEGLGTGAAGTITINGVSLGLGKSSVSTNLAIGASSLISNTSGSRNISIGQSALNINTTGRDNTAVGYFGMTLNGAGNENTSIGSQSLFYSNGNNNVALGYLAGTFISGGGNNFPSNGNIYIGSDSRPLASAQTNQVVIGTSAIGIGSNSVVLGNDSILTTVLKGNVGLGTTNPQSKLEVYGATSTLTINTGDGSTTAGLRFAHRDSVYADSQIKVGIFAPAAGSYGLSTGLFFALNNATDNTNVSVSDSKLAILANGNVGIGTSSPTTPLSIVSNSIGSAFNILGIAGNFLFQVGGVNGIGLISQSNSSTAGFVIGTDGASTTSGSMLRLQTQGSTRLVIDNTGNVGIGTTTPSTKLEIVTTGASIDGLKLNRAADDRTAWLVDEGTGAGALYLFNGSNSNSVFITGNGNSYINSGNLGLGMSGGATAKLDIADTTLSGSGSLAGSILNLAQTWNTTGAPTAIKLNVTNTASGAASNLLDLQVGGVSQFSVNKIGTVQAYSITTNSSGALSLQYAATGAVAIHTNLKIVPSSGFISVNNDLFISRRAAANLKLGDIDAVAPIAQTLSVQSVIAGATNTAGANFTIDGSQGTGTGAGGSIVFRTAAAGSSGSTVNALDTALLITADKRVIPTSLTIDGWLGAIEIFNNLTNAQNRTFPYRAGMITREGIFYKSTGVLAWTSGDGESVDGGNPGLADTILRRDAANTLALRNGVNPQTFRLYNTYTDATTFERLNIKWDTNVLKIGTEKGISGGTARAMELQTDGVTRMTVASGGNVGIGVTNPLYKLEVAGTFKSGTGAVIGQGSSGGISLTVNASTGNNSVPVFLANDEAGSALFSISSTLGSTTTMNSSIVDITNILQVGSKLRIQDQLLSIRVDQSSPANSKLTVKAGDAEYVNRAGGDLDIQSGAGAGSGDGGKITFFTSVGIAAPSITNTQVARMTILPAGNVGIGITSPTEKLDVVGNVKVSGHFSAATKSFLIDHPTKEGKKLQYGVVESNQHSVLVRGKTAENIIELPEEWAGLVHEDSVTVQLTPIGSYQQLFVISQDNQRVVVGGSTGQYNYTIYGERKDVDKLITEI